MKPNDPIPNTASEEYYASGNIYLLNLSGEIFDTGLVSIVSKLEATGISITNINITKTSDIQVKKKLQ